jgi:hypothetical protein
MNLDQLLGRIGTVNIPLIVLVLDFLKGSASLVDRSLQEIEHGHGDENDWGSPHRSGWRCLDFSYFNNGSQSVAHRLFRSFLARNEFVAPRFRVIFAG